MWSDNETNEDFLNFAAVADTAAEMIVTANGQPLSIGISGSWGVGKSSMIKLVQRSLHAKSAEKYVFIEFNAWLYQGFDDARAALMDVIATRLVEHAKGNEKALEKAKKFLGRVNWVRAAGLVGGLAATAASGGLVPPGLVAEGLGAMGALWSGKRDAETLGHAQHAAEGMKEAGTKALEGSKDLLRPEEAPPSPPQQIHELRKHFEETLKAMGVTLVVLVDDLDRCLPATTISTLEAIRLFLFLKHTAFIIAADEKMIRQAVKRHFNDFQLDEDLVTNYFDKLIQVPILVPPLGTQEVRAYMSMLYIERSGLDAAKREELRAAVCKQLSEAWQGKRVDRSFILELLPDCEAGLADQLALADRLAPFMAGAKQIAGNPRLIKRFLNTLSIRLSIARAQNVQVSEAAVAKMLLFERFGFTEAYTELLKAINESGDGKPQFLKSWEAAATEGGEIPDLRPAWDQAAIRDWLKLAPSFADLDLRGVVHVSREHKPIITIADRLSTEAADALNALLAMTGANEMVNGKARAVPPHEVPIVMDKLIERAKEEQAWGRPGVLYALLAMAKAHPSQVKALVGLLSKLPGAQLTAAIVPLVGAEPWGTDVFAAWKKTRDVGAPVLGAIKTVEEGK